MSLLFDVSRSGYYRWLNRKPSERAQEEPRLVAEVKAAHKRNRKTYGAERLQEDLANNGVPIGVHRIKRIKREHDIRCKQRRKYKVNTNSKHNLPVAGSQPFGSEVHGGFT
jgi:putative transposase